jgi:hypothetical protein
MEELKEEIEVLDSTHLIFSNKIFVELDGNIQ